MTHVRLGVNIDHVATVRQARKGRTPDPVDAARACAQAGADSIVCHLREDRRHIQDDDVRRLIRAASIPVNLEMSMVEEIVRIALRLRPRQVTLVPERRAELTTEGGLDVVRYARPLRRVVVRFHRVGVGVSLFIDPNPRQVAAAAASGVRFVELHTGEYANASGAGRRIELRRLRAAAAEARRAGLRVAAGHGLDYDNLTPIVGIADIEEFNIGFAIVARAVFSGLGPAVRQMRALLRRPG